MTFKISRFRRIMRLIEKFPEQHNQGLYHCGTSHCVAGWCDLVAAGYKRPETVDVGRFALGFPLELLQRHAPRTLLTRFAEKMDGKLDGESNNTMSRAAYWLGLTVDEARWLFGGGRTLAELQDVAKTGRFPEGVL